MAYRQHANSTHATPAGLEAPQRDDVVPHAAPGAGAAAACDAKSDAALDAAGMLGMLTDAAEPASASLAADERLRCVLELTMDCYWEQDEAHRFTMLVCGGGDDARATWPSLGQTLRELDAAPYSDGESWATHQAARDARLPFHGLLVRRRDEHGHERFLSVSGQPVHDASGGFRGYRGLIRDATREKRHEKLTALERDVLEILAGTENVSAGLTAAIAAICEAEGWEAGQYWGIDADGRAMQVQESWNVTRDPIRAAMEDARTLEIEIGVGLVGAVWQSRRPLWVADLTHDDRLFRKDIVARTGWGSALLFPVVFEDRVIGVLDFNAKRIPEPDERLLQVIHLLGIQVGNYYQRSMALDRLRSSEALYAGTFELAAIGISHVARDGRFIHVNRQLCDMLGYEREELLELSVKAISHPDDVDATDAEIEKLRAGLVDSIKVEKRYLRKDGATVWVRITVAEKRDGAGMPSYDISVVEDVSARKRAEERIQYLATHDDLTGLPNRAMFGELVEHAVEAGRRRKHKFAVLFIDLDRFKNINDSLGHEAGDVLLREMASRLRSALRGSDVVARLGGDEFVVLLDELERPDQAASVARKLLSSVLRPVEIFGQECRVTGSIGIAMFPEDAEDARLLMRHADMAMYLAKEEGKNNYQFFSKEITSTAVERLVLESHLRRALERNELMLHYQPKLDLRSGKVTGVEALLRWWNPELGTVAPAQFIPLAEETGLIVGIGKWVLKTACEQNVAWQRTGLKPVSVAVNLSPRQFKDAALLDDIAEILETTRMRPELLELEITESMIMSNIDLAIEKLAAIKNLGVRLAIDDFGTGYSSLSQLKRFPIDTLKIDRSFIRDVPTDLEDKAITEAIVAMGRALGVGIVAEGVESALQETFLRSLDCDEMQGFHFAEPRHPDAIAKLLRERD